MTLRNKAPRDHSRSRPRASRVDRRAGSFIGFRRSGRPWTQISRRVTGLWMLSKWNENANARLAARGGNSLFCTKHSLFFIGTGKACQGADLVWQSDAPGALEGKISRKSRKFPVIFPVLRESRLECSLGAQALSACPGSQGVRKVAQRRCNLRQDRARYGKTARDSAGALSERHLSG